jgi:zinc-ribbon domain
VAESQPVFTEEPHTEPNSIHPAASYSNRVCPSCGEENPGDQKFCGMCGVDLFARDAGNRGGAEIRGTEAGGARAEQRPTREVASRGVNPELEENPQARNYKWTDPPSLHGPASPKPIRRRAELLSISDLPRSDREARRQNSWNDQMANQGPNLIPDYEPESYRYRVYLGITLAILLSLFIYMAWRSTLAGRSAARPLPAAVPGTSPQPALQPAPAAEPTKSSAPASARTDTSRQNSVAKTASAPATEAGPAPARSPAGRAFATPAPALASTAIPPASAVSARGNGSEELAIAQTYLSGTAGKARDNGEAAKWLWKSVAKHNDTAALMLSDLYLRGSGVGKNCDQARLLLDAAARKGVSGAAERLRNLQAFGCQ